MPEIISTIFTNLSEIVANYLELASESPVLFATQFMLDGGWLIFIPVVIWGAQFLYIEYKQNKTAAGVKYVHLAIDVPQLNEQSTKAVEQIFAQMAGSLKGINYWDKFFFGDIQEPFSLELVSIGGYTQYIIRTPIFYRDLVESAVYAQYPDAEIFEVEDYTKNVELSFPSDIYDLWGTEFVLEKSGCYPLRTYMAFEHTLTQTFADPMAALLEIMGKISENEQVWLQLVIKPINSSWQATCERTVKKLIGAKATAEKGPLAKLFSPLGALFGGVFEIFQHGYGLNPESASANKRPETPSLMQYLSPGEQEIVKAIQNKTAKIGFKVKFRLIYFGTRETFEKGRGVAAVIGALAQYNTMNLNSFKTAKKTKTKAQYFLVKRRMTKRQRKILKAYQLRSMKQGQGTGFILNIEELASLYHFPTITVKAQLVKKTETKKAGPPVSLPVEHKFKLPQKVSELTEEREQFFGLAQIEESEKIPVALPKEIFEPVAGEKTETVASPEIAVPVIAPTGGTAAGYVPRNSQQEINVGVSPHGAVSSAEKKAEPPDNLPI